VKTKCIWLILILAVLGNQAVFQSAFAESKSQKISRLTDKYCQSDITQLDIFYVCIENLFGQKELALVKSEMEFIYKAIEDMINVNQGYCHRIKDRRPPLLSEGVRVSKTSRIKMLNDEMCMENMPRLQNLNQSNAKVIQAIDNVAGPTDKAANLSSNFSASKKILQEFGIAINEQLKVIEIYCQMNQTKASKSQRIQALTVGMEANLTVPEMLMIYRAED
jgi:hypothetical protein